MSVSTILEIIIGLVLIYYVLGVIVSAVTSWITETLQTRDKGLESYLNGLFEDKSKLDEVMANPLITALKPIRLTPIVGFFTGQTAEYDTEKIPADLFLTAVLGRGIDTYQTFEEVKQAAEKALKGLPDSSRLKKDVSKLIDDAEGNLAQLRYSLESWFDGVMDKASKVFAIHARRIVIALALVVTLISGVDSIDIAQQFWNQPNLRAVASAKAMQIAESGELESDIKALVTTLEELELDYHNDWWNTRNNPDSPNAILLKILG
ncbi:MAG: hypothetical protein ACK2U1_22440, partial [Anaerolineales bacterium]